MSKKYKCFWCNKRFVDLEKHTRNMHPKLTARSYDFNRLLNRNTIELTEIIVKEVRDGIILQSKPYSVEFGSCNHKNCSQNTSKEKDGK